MNQEKNTFDNTEMVNEENSQPLLIRQLATYDEGLISLDDIVDRLIEKVDYLDKFTDEQRDELVDN